MVSIDQYSCYIESLLVLVDGTSSVGLLIVKGHYEDHDYTFSIGGKGKVKDTAGGRVGWSNSLQDNFHDRRAKLGRWSKALV